MRLAYLGVTNVFALLRLLPMSSRVRAAVRPANSSPNPASGRVSGAVRRRYRDVIPSACSANVTRGHDHRRHRNRRTCKETSTGRPPATTRRYLPCTCDDSCPHTGQDADTARHEAEITTASPVSCPVRAQASQVREQHSKQKIILVRNIKDPGGAGRPGRRYGRLIGQRGSRVRRSW
jgi:hypothetical protein